MNRIMSKIYRSNPYDDFDSSEHPIDMQGWGFEDLIFGLAIAALHPTTIVEVGSWKGMSALKMARVARALEIPSCEIVCVDTWLGSPEHVMAANPGWYESLRFYKGYPQLFFTFMANVVHSGLQDIITPFPSTSENAAKILAAWEIVTDLIYIDAAHEFPAARDDFARFWPLLSDEGLMICDDYVGGWPGVVQSVDTFVAEQNLSASWASKPGKAVLAKKPNKAFKTIQLNL